MKELWKNSDQTIAYLIQRVNNQESAKNGQDNKREKVDGQLIF